ncbi:DUF4254 domain-containing protein [Nocardia callitridis]|uniref:DUF4254 domain-containing protein n=1 Tax=Nocardia callitridis TaxID=648753 RepID=A0ABP9L1T3_9NOCA
MTPSLPTRSDLLRACRGETTTAHPLLLAARALTVLHQATRAALPCEAAATTSEALCDAVWETTLSVAAATAAGEERSRCRRASSEYPNATAIQHDSTVTACRQRLIARADYIRTIDRWTATNLPRPPGGAYLHSETLGTVIDRIANYTATAHAALAADDEWDLWFAWERLAEISLAYEDLATELSLGRRRLPTATPADQQLATSESCVEPTRSQQDPSAQDRHPGQGDPRFAGPRGQSARG